MIIIALLLLLFIGFVSSRNIQPTTTTSTTKTKTIVVDNDPDYYRRYGYVPPPRYNPYKAQFY